MVDVSLGNAEGPWLVTVDYGIVDLPLSCPSPVFQECSSLSRPPPLALAISLPVVR